MTEQTQKFLAMSDDELHEILDMFDGRELGHLTPQVRDVVFMMLTKVRAALGISSLRNHAFEGAVFRKKSGDTLAGAVYASVMRGFAGQPEHIRDTSWLLAEDYPLRVRNGVLSVVFQDQSELVINHQTGFAVLQNAARYRRMTVISGGGAGAEDHAE